MHILIIGGGSIGERHLRCFLRCDGVTCSLADPDPARRETLSSTYTLRRAHSDWENVDLSDVDGIVICTPTGLHVPMLNQLADTDVGVLCEKPLAIINDGIDSLSRRLADRDAPVGVAFCYRHNPVFEELKERIDAGDLGPVTVALCQLSQYWPEMRTQWPPQYAVRRETGGGVIPDHLVHFINLLEWFLGPVTSVSAFQRHMRLPDIETEDYGTATLRFQDDQVAVLTSCLFQRKQQVLVQIVGDDATAAFDLADDHLRIYRASDQVWEMGTTRSVERDDLFHRQASHFLACIRGDAVPRCTVEEAARTLDVVLAAVKSSDGSGGFEAL